MSTDTQEKTPAQKQSGAWQSLLSKIIRPRPTGVTCEYCGWSGAKDGLLKSPRLNEDGTVYQIMTCPQCLRNGGLIFYD